MYVAVAIYTTEDATFVGYAVKEQDRPKLQSTNIWVEGEEAELEKRLAALNTDVDLRQHWPNPKDPDVLSILDDPEFMPIEYVEAEVIDEDHSHYVWKQEPEYDPVTGAPTGQMVQGSELDELASVINYKKGKVPKRPTDVMLRIKCASEKVARKRAGLID